MKKLLVFCVILCAILLSLGIVKKEWEEALFSLNDMTQISEASPFNLSDNSFIRQIYPIKIPEVPNAYNATLIEDGTGYLMAFRYDEYALPVKPPIIWPHYYQRIGFIRLNAQFEPIGKWIPCEALGNRAYDPRLIKVGDQLFLTYTSALPGAPHSIAGSLVGVTQIYLNKDDVKVEPPTLLKAPFQQTWEKNWVPFNYQQQLTFSYSINPHVVLAFSSSNEKCVCLSTSKSALKWDWGILRGGTPALLIDGEYLAFFHSSKKNPQTGHSTYYIGAYTFQAQPPFNLTRLSSQPFVHRHFYSSPTTHVLTRRSSAHVLFPGGLIVKDDRLYICYGENDACIKVMEIDKKKLYDSLIKLH